MSKFKGLYSAVDEAAKALKRGKGTGKEFMTEVLKTPGVKPTEIKERGLQKIEAMPKMTKEEFLKKIEENPAPKIEEKVLKEPSKVEIEDRAHELAYDDAMDELRAEGMNRHEAADIAAEQAEDNAHLYYDQAAEDLAEEGGSAYHGNYTIPGGQNYREVLLKVPSFKDDAKIMELEATRRRIDPEFHPARYNELTQQIEALKAQKAAMPEQFQGVEQHFGGEPGILASIRVSDRVMPSYTKKQAEEIGQRIADSFGVADHKNLGNGSIDRAIKTGVITPKEAAQYADFRGFQGVDTTGAKQKVLHIEEIQSDWHQEGRSARNNAVKRLMKEQGLTKDEANALVPEDFGYRNAETEARRKELEKLAAPYMDGSRAMPPELRKEIESLPPMTAMPDAPFKKNWHELALKRMLNYAAENGYDKIAITPGAEQADRYSLAKHVNQVEVYKLDDGLYNLEVIDKNGKSVSIPHSRAVTPDRISEIVGKDVAEKAVKQADQSGQSILGGLDLEVGGEGMKGFYDKMLPDYLNTYGKKYGARVSPMDIITHPEKSIPQIAAPGIDYFPEPVVQPAKTTQVHSFDITPQMREEIAGKGLPLYQQIGIPAGGAAAGAGALEGQEEPGFAEGGPVMAAKGGEFNTDPDMADGGVRIQGPVFKKGGRVNVTDNPDTMWLELVSKN